MKRLNDCIRLCFKNANADGKDMIFSKKTFPIEITTKGEKCTEVVFSYGNNQKLFHGYLTALADYICTHYETKLLKHLLITRFEEIKPFQVQDVLNGIWELEQDKDLCYQKRRDTVKSGLCSYFSDEKSASSIDGLISFRLKEYEALLSQVAEQLYDNYLMHKEYEEFIELLRYFVNVQIARPTLTHLIVHHHGMYTILNESKEDITAECISDFARPDEIHAENFDDLLISMLITLAPEKIVVHNCGEIKNAELFETIQKVFDKVEYCAGCSMCGTADIQYQ